MSIHLLPFRSYQLSRSQELLLQAILLEREDAITAWEEWQSLVDIEILDSESNVLLPRLYLALSNYEVKHPHMARLKGIYRRTWYVNQLRLKYLKKLLFHLNNVGIKAILIGDAGQYYDIDHESKQVEFYRSISSFHLLVHDSKIDIATQTLKELNWQVFNTKSPTYIHFKDSQEYSLYLQGHLFWAIPQDYTDEQVWNYARPIFRDEIGWRLSSTDRFLDGCARTFFHRRSSQVYSVADAMSLIRNESNDLDWVRLIAQAQRYQMILPVRNMLILLKEVLYYSAPAWVLPALWQMPVAHSEWLTYQRLAIDRRSWGQPTIAQSMQSLSQLKSQLQSLKNLPFPGRQILKNLLKPTKSALE